MQARSLSLVSFLVVAACGGGGGGSGPTADDEAYRLDRLSEDLFDETGGNDGATTDPMVIADVATGTVEYTGAMLLRAGVDPEETVVLDALGDFRASSNFDDNTFTGDVTNIVDAEGNFFFNGELELQGGTINQPTMVVSDVIVDVDLAGQLTDPSGTVYDIAADVTGTFRGDDFEYFFGGFDDAGTVTVGSTVENIDIGQLLGERPVDPPVP